MFGFLGKYSFVPSPLNPRIGSFIVVNMHVTFTAEAGFGVTATEVPLDEIQKTKNEGALKLLSSYGSS